MPIKSNMEREVPTMPMTCAEKETQTAAERLHQQIDDSLTAVAVHAKDDRDELEACADRLERAARDLAAALREIARERRVTREAEE
jgi:hypothetical protein